LGLLYSGTKRLSFNPLLFFIFGSNILSKRIQVEMGEKEIEERKIGQV
jgi:hypothetical protein